MMPLVSATLIDPLPRIDTCADWSSDCQAAGGADAPPTWRGVRRELLE